LPALPSFAPNTESRLAVPRSAAQRKHTSDDAQPYDELTGISRFSVIGETLAQPRLLGY
jgi:hypothetical protein